MKREINDLLIVGFVAIFALAYVAFPIYLAWEVGRQGGDGVLTFLIFGGLMYSPIIKAVFIIKKSRKETKKTEQYETEHNWENRY